MKTTLLLVAVACVVMGAWATEPDTPDNVNEEILPQDVPQGAFREKCTSQYCNQFCRSMGYKGGECVNGKCDCDRF